MDCIHREYTENFLTFTVNLNLQVSQISGRILNIFIVINSQTQENTKKTKLTKSVIKILCLSKKKKKTCNRTCLQRHKLNNLFVLKQTLGSCCMVVKKKYFVASANVHFSDITLNYVWLLHMIFPYNITIMKINNLTFCEFFFIFNTSFNLEEIMYFL